MGKSCRRYVGYLCCVDPSSYSVTGAQVCAVWRKTKPNDIAEYSHFHNLYSPVFAGKTKPDNITQGRSDFCYDHVFYLVLDHAPAEGDVLTLSFPRLKLDCESVTYTHGTRNTHSRSVFTTQLVFGRKIPEKKVTSPAGSVREAHSHLAVKHFM